MIKSIQSQSQDDLENLAKKARVVRVQSKNETSEYTLTKKSTAMISRELVGLQNAFNKILSNTKNVKVLEEVQSKLSISSPSVAYVPIPAKIIGEDVFTNGVKVLGQYFESLSDKLKKLDLNTNKTVQQDAGVVNSKRTKTNTRKFSTKSLGIFAVGMDLAERIGVGEGLVEAGIGVAGGAAGGYTGVGIGAAIGTAVGGRVAPMIGGVVGGALGYLGGGYAAGSAYKASTQQSPAEKKLESVVAKTASVPAIQEPTEISNNSYSSRFASYLNQAFNNVNSYISGLFRQDTSGDIDYYANGGAEGAGAGLTANASTALNFFMSPEGGGWTKEQAIGIIANLQQESRLDPSAFNSAGGGHGAAGIAQWRGPRQEKFEELYKKPIRNSSLQDQLRYVNWELSHTHKSAGNILRTAKTSEQATTIVYKEYEKPGAEDRSFGKRLANAASLIQSSVNDTAQLVGGQLINPLPGSRISSNFGRRVAPKSGASTDHKGIDMAGKPIGTPVLAAQAGTVIGAGNVGGYGTLVEIDHGGGLKTKYGHMSALLVRKGDVVRVGQPIGKVGNEGNSTGPHLHFEVLQNDNPTDPMRFLAQKQTPPQKPVWKPNPTQLEQALYGPKKKGNGSLLIVNPPAQQSTMSPLRLGNSRFMPSSQSNASGQQRLLGYYN